jgi:hypothetical protein
VRRWLAAFTLLLVACQRQPAAPPRAPYTPPPCPDSFAVNIRLDPAIATAATPKQLQIPTPIIRTVTRMGIELVTSQIVICSGALSSVGRIKKSTGFADLDQFLATHVTELGVEAPTSDCTTIKLQVGRFEYPCVQQFACSGNSRRTDASSLLASNSQ